MGLATVMNGRPTKPQADRIVERVRALSEGDTISHQELEVLTEAKRGEHRYRTVIGAAFRRVARELSIVMQSVRGVGYQVPTGYEQLRNGVGMVRLGVKRIGRGVATAKIVTDKRLPDARHRQVRDHIVTTAKYLHEFARNQRKALESTVGRPDVSPQLPISKTG
jgi:hypothetical protein